MIRFEYHETRSIEEAISFANNFPEKPRMLAGGTELLPKLKQRALTGDQLVNLKRIPELGPVCMEHTRSDQFLAARHRHERTIRLKSGMRKENVKETYLGMGFPNGEKMKTNHNSKGGRVKVGRVE